MDIEKSYKNILPVKYAFVISGLNKQYKWTTIL